MPRFFGTMGLFLDIPKERAILIISVFWPVMENFIRGYCFYRFTKPFVRRKEAAFRAGAVYFLFMLFLFLMPWRLRTYTAYGLGVLTAYLAFSIADRRNYCQKAYLAITFFSLNWFAVSMAEILYDNVYNYLTGTEYMAGHPEMDVFLYMGACAAYLALQFLFTAAGSWYITKIFHPKGADIGKRELFMLSIPSFMGVIGYEIMRYYRMFYIIETGGNTKGYDALSFLYCMVSVAAAIVVAILYQKMKSSQEEQLRAELLAAQIGGIQNHIFQVEALYQDIRSMKHDMANHILTLERLYAREQIEEARAYASSLKAGLAETAGKITSGNPVTDVVLQEWKQEAEKRNIPFHTTFYFPEGCGINAFDVSVILHNALQNAVENTVRRKEAYISIRSYRKSNAYMIEIRNYFTGSLQWDPESGLLCTSKKAQDRHGYGLANIRKVAQKYSGDIEVSQGDKEFCLCVMMIASSRTCLQDSEI
ncbi:ATP-binding protein [Lachnospiraceae bacterium 29-84]